MRDGRPEVVVVRLEENLVAPQHHHAAEALVRRGLRHLLVQRDPRVGARRQRVDVRGAHVDVLVAELRRAEVLAPDLGQHPAAERRPGALAALGARHVVHDQARVRVRRQGAAVARSERGRERPQPAVLARGRGRHRCGGGGGVRAKYRASVQSSESRVPVVRAPAAANALYSRVFFPSSRLFSP